MSSISVAGSIVSTRRNKKRGERGYLEELHAGLYDLLYFCSRETFSFYRLPEEEGKLLYRINRGPKSQRGLSRPSFLRPLVMNGIHLDGRFLVRHGCISLNRD